ncbi:hypothetical protein A3Q56_05404 [Intoshia linei]|uniref:Uncharacterized protein n=1 Tax=Intoshia linei TaxID=1819745 RepID=A0A177AY21_9BILA|nr:hypothetical protein A3Q56_05404 [Intoshia linei]
MNNSNKKYNFEHDRIRFLREQRILVQKKTFAKWCNTHLEKLGLHVEDLFTDFSDGIKLIRLLESISDVKFDAPNRGLLRVQKIENINKCLKFLKKQVRLENIGPQDIVDGEERLILGLIWTLILRFQIQTVKFIPDDKSISEPSVSGKCYKLKRSPKDDLLLWAQTKTKDYSNVEITNFTTSWTSGYAFGCLLHAHTPKSINLNLFTDNCRNNLEIAFKCAENIGIPQLLDPDDVENSPDEKSILTYVSLCFHNFAKMKIEVTGSKRIGRIINNLLFLDYDEIEYEKLSKQLIQWCLYEIDYFNKEPDAMNEKEIRKLLSSFSVYLTETKREKLAIRGKMESKFFSMNTKRTTLGMDIYEPDPLISLSEISSHWDKLEKCENEYESLLKSKLKWVERMNNLEKLYYKKSNLRDEWIDEMSHLMKMETLHFEYTKLGPSLQRHEALVSDFESKQNLFEKLQTIVDELEASHFIDIETIKKHYFLILDKYDSLRKIEKEKSKCFNDAKLLLEGLKFLDVVDSSVKEFEKTKLIKLYNLSGISNIDKIKRYLERREILLEELKNLDNEITVQNKTAEELCKKEHIPSEISMQLLARVTDSQTAVKLLIKQVQVQIEDVKLKCEFFDFSLCVEVEISWLRKQCKFTKLICKYPDLTTCETNLESLNGLSKDYVNREVVQLDIHYRYKKQFEKHNPNEKCMSDLTIHMAKFNKRLKLSKLVLNCAIKVLLFFQDCRFWQQSFSKHMEGILSINKDLIEKNSIKSVHSVVMIQRGITRIRNGKNFFITESEQVKLLADKIEPIKTEMESVINNLLKATKSKTCLIVTKDFYDENVTLKVGEKVTLICKNSFDFWCVENKNGLSVNIPTCHVVHDRKMEVATKDTFLSDKNFWFHFDIDNIKLAYNDTDKMYLKVIESYKDYISKSERSLKVALLLESVDNLDTWIEGSTLKMCQIEKLSNSITNTEAMKQMCLKIEHDLIKYGDLLKNINESSDSFREECYLKVGEKKEFKKESEMQYLQNTKNYKLGITGMDAILVYTYVAEPKIFEINSKWNGMLSSYKDLRKYNKKLKCTEKWESVHSELKEFIKIKNVDLNVEIKIENNLDLSILKRKFNHINDGIFQYEKKLKDLPQLLQDILLCDTVFFNKKDGIQETLQEMQSKIGKEWQNLIETFTVLKSGLNHVINIFGFLKKINFIKQNVDQMFDQLVNLGKFTVDDESNFINVQDKLDTLTNLSNKLDLYRDNLESIESGLSLDSRSFSSQQCLKNSPFFDIYVKQKKRVDENVDNLKKRIKNFETACNELLEKIKLIFKHLAFIKEISKLQSALTNFSKFLDVNCDMENIDDCNEKLSKFEETMTYLNINLNQLNSKLEILNQGPKYEHLKISEIYLKTKCDFDEIQKRLNKKRDSIELAKSKLDLNNQIQDLLQWTRHNDKLLKTIEGENSNQEFDEMNVQFRYREVDKIRCNMDGRQSFLKNIEIQLNKFENDDISEKFNKLIVCWNDVYEKMQSKKSIYDKYLKKQSLQYTLNFGYNVIEQIINDLEQHTNVEQYSSISIAKKDFTTFNRHVKQVEVSLNIMKEFFSEYKDNVSQIQSNYKELYESFKQVKIPLEEKRQFIINEIKRVNFLKYIDDEIDLTRKHLKEGKNLHTRLVSEENFDVSNLQNNVNRLLIDSNVSIKSFDEWYNGLLDVENENIKNKKDKYFDMNKNLHIKLDEISNNLKKCNKSRINSLVSQDFADCTKHLLDNVQHEFKEKDNVDIMDIYKNLKCIGNDVEFYDKFVEKDASKTNENLRQCYENFFCDKSHDRFKNYVYCWNLLVYSNDRLEMIEKDIKSFSDEISVNFFNIQQHKYQFLIIDKCYKRINIIIKMVYRNETFNEKSFKDTILWFKSLTGLSKIQTLKCKIDKVNEEIKTTLLELKLAIDNSLNVEEKLKKIKMFSNLFVLENEKFEQFININDKSFNYLIKKRVVADHFYKFLNFIVNLLDKQEFKLQFNTDKYFSVFHQSFNQEYENFLNTLKSVIDKISLVISLQNTEIAKFRFYFKSLSICLTTSKFVTCINKKIVSVDSKWTFTQLCALMNFIDLLSREAVHLVHRNILFYKENYMTLMDFCSHLDKVECATTLNLNCSNSLKSDYSSLYDLDETTFGYFSKPNFEQIHQYIFTFPVKFMENIAMFVDFFECYICQPIFKYEELKIFVKFSHQKMTRNYSHSKMENYIYVDEEIPCIGAITNGVKLSCSRILQNMTSLSDKFKSILWTNQKSSLSDILKYNKDNVTNELCAYDNFDFNFSRNEKYFENIKLVDKPFFVLLNMRRNLEQTIQTYCKHIDEVDIVGMECIPANLLKSSTYYKFIVTTNFIKNFVENISNSINNVDIEKFKNLYTDSKATFLNLLTDEKCVFDGIDSVKEYLADLKLKLEKMNQIKDELCLYQPLIDVYLELLNNPKLPDIKRLVNYDSVDLNLAQLYNGTVERINENIVLILNVDQVLKFLVEFKRIDENIDIIVVYINDQTEILKKESLYSTCHLITFLSKLAVIKTHCDIGAIKGLKQSISKLNAPHNEISKKALSQLIDKYNDMKNCIQKYKNNCINLQKYDKFLYELEAFSVILTNQVDVVFSDINKENDKLIDIEFNKHKQFNTQASLVSLQDRIDKLEKSVYNFIKSFSDGEELLKEKVNEMISLWTSLENGVSKKDGYYRLVEGILNLISDSEVESSWLKNVIEKTEFFLKNTNHFDVYSKYEEIEYEYSNIHKFKIHNIVSSYLEFEQDGNFDLVSNCLAIGRYKKIKGEMIQLEEDIKEKIAILKVHVNFCGNYNDIYVKVYKIFKNCQINIENLNNLTMNSEITSFIEKCFILTPEIVRNSVNADCQALNEVLMENINQTIKEQENEAKPIENDSSSLKENVYTHEFDDFKLKEILHISFSVNLAFSNMNFLDPKLNSLVVNTRQEMMDISHKLKEIEIFVKFQKFYTRFYKFENKFIAFSNHYLDSCIYSKYLELHLRNFQPKQFNTHELNNELMRTTAEYKLIKVEYDCILGCYHDYVISNGFSEEKYTQYLKIIILNINNNIDYFNETYQNICLNIRVFEEYIHVFNAGEYVRDYCHHLDIFYPKQMTKRYDLNQDFINTIKNDLLNLGVVYKKFKLIINYGPELLLKMQEQCLVSTFKDIEKAFNSHMEVFRMFVYQMFSTKYDIESGEFVENLLQLYSLNHIQQKFVHLSEMYPKNAQIESCEMDYETIKSKLVKLDTDEMELEYYRKILKIICKKFNIDVGNSLDDHNIKSRDDFVEHKRNILHYYSKPHQVVTENGSEQNGNQTGQIVSSSSNSENAEFSEHDTLNESSDFMIDFSESGLIPKDNDQSYPMYKVKHLYFSVLYNMVYFREKLHEVEGVLDDVAKLKNIILWVESTKNQLKKMNDDNFDQILDRHNYYKISKLQIQDYKSDIDKFYEKYQTGYSEYTKLIKKEIESTYDMLCSLNISVDINNKKIIIDIFKSAIFYMCDKIKQNYENYKDKCIQVKVDKLSSSEIVQIILDMEEYNDKTRPQILKIIQNVEKQFENLIKTLKINQDEGIFISVSCKISEITCGFNEAVKMNLSIMNCMKEIEKQDTVIYHFNENIDIMKKQINEIVTLHNIENLKESERNYLRGRIYQLKATKVFLDNAYKKKVDTVVKKLDFKIIEKRKSHSNIFLGKKKQNTRIEQIFELQSTYSKIYIDYQKKLNEIVQFLNIQSAREKFLFYLNRIDEIHLNIDKVFNVDDYNEDQYYEACIYFKNLKILYFSHVENFKFVNFIDEKLFTVSAKCPLPNDIESIINKVKVKLEDIKTKCEKCHEKIKEHKNYMNYISKRKELDNWVSKIEAEEKTDLNSKDFLVQEQNELLSIEAANAHFDYIAKCVSNKTLIEQVLDKNGKDAIEPRSETVKKKKRINKYLNLGNYIDFKQYRTFRGKKLQNRFWRQCYVVLFKYSMKNVKTEILWMYNDLFIFKSRHWKSQEPIDVYSLLNAQCYVAKTPKNKKHTLSLTLDDGSEFLLTFSNSKTMMAWFNEIRFRSENDKSIEKIAKWNFENGQKSVLIRAYKQNTDKRNMESESDDFEFLSSESDIIEEEVPEKTEYMCKISLESANDQDMLDSHPISEKNSILVENTTLDWVEDTVEGNVATSSENNQKEMAVDVDPLEDDNQSSRQINPNEPKKKKKRFIFFSRRKK